MVTKATRDVIDLSVRPVNKLVVNNVGNTLGPRRIDATAIGASVPDVGFFTNVQSTAGNVSNLQSSNVIISSLLDVTGATVIGLNLNDRIITVNLSANYTAQAADRGKGFLCNGTFSFFLDNAATLGVGWSCQIKNTGIGNVTIDPFSTQTINDTSTVVLTPAQSCQIVCTGTTTFQVFFLGSGGSGGGGSAAIKNMIAVDQKAANTSGGTTTAGTFLTRNLNTILSNTIAGATVTANQFTLPAGNYNIKWWAPAYNCARHKSKLRNITDAVDVAMGSSEYALGTADVQTSSFGSVDVSLGSAKTFEIQHRVQNAQTGDGFGVAANFGVPEVFTIVEVTRKDITGVAGGGGGSGTVQLMVVQDQKVAGTNGGTAIANTWTARALNAIQTNSITGASLASNTVTLPAGTYHAHASAPFFHLERAKIRLRNVTDNTTAVVGSCAYSNIDQDSDVSSSILDGVFTIASNKNFQIQYFTSTNGEGNAGALGLATTGSGEIEVYAQVRFWKLA